MKNLYLHIGLGKTGSSALQSWLSLNSSALLQQGYSYADLVPEAKLGKVSSGNGYVLFVALRKGDYTEAERLITESYFVSGCERAIISCELLQNLARTRLQALQEIFARHDIQVTVIAYVRSFYEHLYSTYAQHVKSGSTTHAFGSDSEDLDAYKYVEVLMKYARYVRNRFVVLNYNDPACDVFTSFAAAVGVDTASTSRLKATVNRSLTIGEIDALRQINALHGGAFSTRIFDYLAQQYPDRRSEIYYTEELVREVREQSAAEVAWINHQFRLTPPLQTDQYTNKTSKATPGHCESAITATVRWAQAFEPRSEQALAFAGFLRNLAAQLGGMGQGGDSAKLQARAAVVEASHDQRAAAGAGAHADAAQEVESQFLIAYILPERVLSPEEEKSFGLALTHWIAPLRKSSVGSMLYGLQQPLELTPQAKDAPRAMNGVRFTSYTIVRIPSLDDLMALVAACPVLDIGGSVQIFRHEALPFV